jgi:hypothetical protein
MLHREFNISTFLCMPILIFSCFMSRFSGSSHPEDRGSKVLRNFGILPQHYTASQSRRPRIFTAVKATNLSSSSSSYKLRTVHIPLSFRIFQCSTHLHTSSIVRSTIHDTVTSERKKEICLVVPCHHGMVRLRVMEDTSSRYGG